MASLEVGVLQACPTGHFSPGVRTSGSSSSSGRDLHSPPARCALRAAARIRCFALCFLAPRPPCRPPPLKAAQRQGSGDRDTKLRTRQAWAGRMERGSSGRRIALRRAWHVVRHSPKEMRGPSAGWTARNCQPGTASRTASATVEGTQTMADGAKVVRRSSEQELLRTFITVW